MNKVGGAVILDCLTAEEIADIMIACVKPKPVHVAKAPAPNKIVDDAQTIKMGNEIKVVSLDNGKQHAYKITENFKKTIRRYLQ